MKVNSDFLSFIFDSASRFYSHVMQLQSANLRIKRIGYVMLCYVMISEHAVSKRYGRQKLIQNRSWLYFRCEAQLRWWSIRRVLRKCRDRFRSVCLSSWPCPPCTPTFPLPSYTADRRTGRSPFPDRTRWRRRHRAASVQCRCFEPLSETFGSDLRRTSSVRFGSHSTPTRDLQAY